MLRRSQLAIVSVLAVGLATSGDAQSATQVVRFQVNAVNQIAVSGEPAPMIINSATPGQQPASVTASGASYAVTTNEQNQKITASLNQPMPTGLTLEVVLAAPAGATSSGSVSLGTAASDVVTGISTTAASALPILYRLSATTSVQMPAPASRTITYTIVSGT